MSQEHADQSQHQSTENFDSEIQKKEIDPVAQAKWLDSIGRPSGWGIYENNPPAQMFLQEEEEPVQGKAKEEDELQMQTEEEELQMKSDSVSSGGSETGIPGGVKSKMESSFGTDFSGVKVHQNSSKAANIGALAYTQGSDVHFAPGQYNPGTSKGQQLLGHELTHVVQQREGRVQPTTEVGGTPVNDTPALEKEADDLGAKAVKGKMADVKGNGSGVQMKGEENKDNEKPIRNKQELIDRYTDTWMKSVDIALKVENRKTKWQSYAMGIMNFYNSALGRFRKTLKDQDEWEDTLNDLCWGVVSAMLGGVVTHIGKLSKSKLLKEQSNSIEAVVDVAEDALQNISITSIKKLGSKPEKPSMPEDTIVVQNNLLISVNKCFISISDQLEFIRDLIAYDKDLVDISLSANNSKSNLNKHIKEYKYIEGCMNTVLESEQDFLQEPPSLPNKDDFIKEISRGFYANWLPELSYEMPLDYDISANTDTWTAYKCNFCRALKKDLRDFGIEADAKVDLGYTKMTEVKELVKWAKRHQKEMGKSIIKLP